LVSGRCHKVHQNPPLAPRTQRSPARPDQTASAIRKSPSLPRASVSTWLLAIARYKALSAHRRRIDAELDARIASTVADPADDPEAALQKKNRSELLRNSLAELSPEHGEVIDLVYYHGKSVKEVADIVGVAEATVKTRMFYARKKLADLVATGGSGCSLG
jgi:RNA polymerase sigma-70 factor (ECF subfamily)